MRGTPRSRIALAASGLCIGFAPAVAAAAPACVPTPAPAEEAALTALINAQRKAEGVPRVAKQVDLAREGRQKSMAMARGAKFAHSGPLHWAHGRAGAQNIAMAPTSSVAFQAMLASPAHRRNMMARVYRLTGVGAAYDCAGQIYFTVNLMAPA